MALHPKIVALLEAGKALPRLNQMPVAEARAFFARRCAALPPATEALAEVRDLKIADGLGARLYRPRSDAATPLLLYFHGGGFVIGSPQTHDGICRRLCARSGLTLLSVDYRLAPEHPYPAASDDAWRALNWAAEHAQKLGAPTRGLHIAGDSAGGTLAAGAALRAVHERGPRLDSMALVYPALAAPSRGFDSYRDCAEGYGLSAEVMHWFWQQYVPDSRLAAGAAPLDAPSKAGLPPTLVINAGYDVLRDEAAAFAQQLERDGVPVKLSTYEAMNHGFIALSGIVEDADRAIAEVCDWIRRHPLGGEK